MTEQNLGLELFRECVKNLNESDLEKVKADLLLKFQEVKTILAFKRELETVQNGGR